MLEVEIKLTITLFSPTLVKFTHFGILVFNSFSMYKSVTPFYILENIYFYIIYYNNSKIVYNTLKINLL